MFRNLGDLSEEPVTSSIGSLVMVLCNSNDLATSGFSDLLAHKAILVAAIFYDNSIDAFPLVDERLGSR